MRQFFLSPALLFLLSSSFAADPVDSIDQKFRKMETEGLLKLHDRHIGELEEVKESAMSAADLTLATKASDRIKLLQTEVISLKEKIDELQKGEPVLPENQFYKMTYASGKTGTEKGAKIFLNFERLPLTDFAGDKLFLVITAGAGKDSETAHQIFVFDETTGKEIGMTSALGRGNTKKIPLLVPPSDILKLAVAVKGGDALHLKQEEQGIPEVYLEIGK